MEKRGNALPANRPEGDIPGKTIDDPMGIVVRVQRFSLDDGPGIRTTVFLKGCPLRCLWCSNPETQKPQVEIMWNRKLCTPECSNCIKICEADALSRKGDCIHVNSATCTQCAKCITVCAKRALTKVGSAVNVSHVVDEVKRDVVFYKSSGGGVTISGGEPMYQEEFAKELARRCRAEEISVALDTCGFADWDSYVGIAPFVNLYLFDIKHMDPVVHKKLTGVDNTIILKNLNGISNFDTPIILRMPVIPGINDSDNNLEALARLARDTKNVTCVHLLPYHRLGIGKYEALGREYILEHLKEPSREWMMQIREKLTGYGVRVEIIG